jgi:hypothetical protein
LTWQGGGQSALVLLVVWWSWNYTTWATNELDPRSIVVRLLLSALMLASLRMAIAIPKAFGDKALLFAGSYVRDPGRAPVLSDLCRRRSCHDRAPAGWAHPGLVRRCGRALDRGRLDADGALVGGARA